MLKSIHNMLISFLPAGTLQKASIRDLERNPYRTARDAPRASESTSQEQNDLNDLMTNPYRDAFIRNDETNPPQGLPAEDTFDDLTNPYRDGASRSAMKEPSSIIDVGSSDDPDLEINPYKEP